jgi:hypothetical protein
MPVSAKPHHKLRGFPAKTLQMFVRLPPALQHLLQECPDPADLLPRLTELGLLTEATRLLAYTLPEREAVWWACMCVEYTAPTDLPIAERAAVEAAKAWVWRPDEAARQEAWTAATISGYHTASGWAALGAAWSHRTPFKQAISGGHGAEKAIALASVRDDRGREQERRHRFIEGGIDIANGGAGRLPATSGRQT